MFTVYPNDQEMSQKDQYKVELLKFEKYQRLSSDGGLTSFGMNGEEIVWYNKFHCFDH